MIFFTGLPHTLDIKDILKLLEVLGLLKVAQATGYVIFKKKTYFNDHKKNLSLV